MHKKKHDSSVVKALMHIAFKFLNYFVVKIHVQRIILDML